MEVQRYDHRLPTLEPGRHRFRLKQIDFDGTFEYSPEVEVVLEVPDLYVLSAAHPNPFNPSTTFTLILARRQPVELSVYDVWGRRVALLYQGVLPENEAYFFTFEAAGLPSGTYLIRAASASFIATQFVTLLK